MLDKYFHIEDNTKLNQAKISNSFPNNNYFSHIPCDILFDINIHEICLDVPEYYYQNNPKYYNKVKIHFTLKNNINYTKSRTCQINDNIIYINKIDKNIIKTFWIIL